MTLKHFMKQVVKVLTPYGIIYLYSRKLGKGYEQKFILDKNYKIVGWMEPAHIKIKLDPNDWIQGQIFRNGGYEKKIYN
jgi:hypothetical protein